MNHTQPTVVVDYKGCEWIQLLTGMVVGHICPGFAQLLENDDSDVCSFNWAGMLCLPD